MSPYREFPREHLEKLRKQAEKIEVQMKSAKEILGPDFLGPEAVEKTFGIKPETIPPIPFSEQELKEAKELGQFLILRVNKALDGAPLTMEKMQDLVNPVLQREKKGRLFADLAGWKVNESFFTQDVPRAGWALASKEVIPNSTNKNFLEQSELLAQYLTTKVFKNHEMPEPYKQAIEELRAKKSTIESFIESNWEEAARQLSALKLNQLTRHIPVEAIFDEAVNLQAQNRRFLENRYTWTPRLFSHGSLVSVGDFDVKGAFVTYDSSGLRGGRLGVSFSRNQ